MQSTVVILIDNPLRRFGRYDYHDEQPGNPYLDGVRPKVVVILDGQWKAKVIVWCEVGGTRTFELEVNLRPCPGTVG